MKSNPFCLVHTPMNRTLTMSAALACLLSSPARAQDDQELMVLTKLNVGEQLAAACDKLKPGTLSE